MRKFLLAIILIIAAPVFAQSPIPTPTPLSGCWDPPPGGSVQLKTATPSGEHDVLLTWTEASAPVSYYLLSYGLAPGTYSYGNPNMGGQGTTSYTVGNLTTGKRYYFVVRAGNGCTPGVFSNELSAVAGETPVPTLQQEDDRSPDATPTPVITDTPSPIPTPEPNVLAAETSVPVKPDMLIPTIMLGATALGIVCALIGIFLLLRMKKGNS